MLENNYEIERGAGEYKDFPYRYTLYLYGTKVWTDDFDVELSDKQVLKEFIKDLDYVAEGLGE